MKNFAKYFMAIYYGVFCSALGFSVTDFKGFIVVSFGCAVICEIYRLSERCEK